MKLTTITIIAALLASPAFAITDHPKEEPKVEEPKPEPKPDPKPEPEPETPSQPNAQGDNDRPTAPTRCEGDTARSWFSGDNKWFCRQPRRVIFDHDAPLNKL